MVSVGELPDRNFDIGFFDDEPTHRVVAAVGAATTLTLFLGAGVSADLGIPNWSDLVLNLLDEVIEHSSDEDSSDDILKLSEATLDYYHQMPAASIVDELYRRRVNDAGSRQDPKRARNLAIRRLIYDENPLFDEKSLPAGALSRYILRLARIKKRNGCDVRIVTTNYDQVLEMFASRDRTLHFSKIKRLSVEARDTGLEDQIKEGVIPVYHAHGTIPRRGSVNDASVIFSEQQYIDWDQSGWPSHVQHRLAADGIVLFLGTSLRDYNIAGLIRRSSKIDGKGERIAILPVQDEYQMAEQRAHAYPDRMLSHANRRGRHLGTGVLRPDFYGQVSQLLHEMTLASEPKTTDVPIYHQRLDAWFTGWSGRQQKGIATLESQAVDLRNLANSTLESLRQAVGDWVGFSKAELWVRSQPRMLELWQSSQSIPVRSHDGGTPDPSYRPHMARIRVNSPYAAVDVFAARFPTFGTINHRSDQRWSHFFGVPIILEDRPHYELPVGALLLLLSLDRPIDDKRRPEQVADRKTLRAALAGTADEMRRLGVDLLLNAAMKGLPASKSGQ